MLAAGRSRRFGAANKLLAAVAGQPLLWHTLDALCASRARPIVIVVGHQQWQLRRSLSAYRRQRRHGPPLRCVLNPAFRSGMASSLRRGLAALPAPVDGALICLGDMPDLRASVIERLCRAWRHGDDALVPVADGRRGHPVLLGRPLFAAVEQQLRGDTGARPLLTRAARVRELRTPETALRDIDTQRQWRSAKRRPPDRRHRRKTR